MSAPRLFESVPVVTRPVVLPRLRADRHQLGAVLAGAVGAVPLLLLVVALVVFR